MFPANFDYRPARSVDEALEALAQYGDDARVLAGGQSLIPAMRFRLARPSVLVDINPIAGLGYLQETGGSLRVGATTRDFALETAAMIGERYRLIAEKSAVVADPVGQKQRALVERSHEARRIAARRDVGAVRPLSRDHAKRRE